jgi:hypothetical protein
MITFVLLRSPLAALRDSETVIIHRKHRSTNAVVLGNLIHTPEMLSGEPSLSEILWNFGRYQGRARVTLEQNPHFYSSLPANESRFTPLFKRHPLRDFRKALKSHDTVYILVDTPSRMFFETEGEKRSFGNVWMLNGTLIWKGLCLLLTHPLLSDAFPDRNGVLEGDQSIRSFSIGGRMRSCQRPVVFSNSESLSRLDHSSLPPIITTPSTSLAFRSPSKDRTDLSSPASCSGGIPINSTQDASWLSGPSKGLVCVHASDTPHGANTSSLT